MKTRTEWYLLAPDRTNSEVDPNISPIACYAVVAGGDAAEQNWKDMQSFLSKAALVGYNSEYAADTVLKKRPLDEIESLSELPMIYFDRNGIIDKRPAMLKDWRSE